MSSSYGTYYTTSGAIPMAVPAGKVQYSPYATSGTYYNTGGSAYSVSPPEQFDSGSMTSASAGGSGTYGSTGYSGTASYASSSQGDYDSAGSASGVDFNDYMQDRFADSFDPIPLDRAMVGQAQTSGKLNAKQRELLELQAKAQARLAKSRARFAQGLEDAREVRADLEWTQKKVSSLKTKASKKHSKEYSQARARYPSPEY